MKKYKFDFNSQSKKHIINLSNSMTNFLEAIILFFLIKLLCWDLNLYLYPWYYIFYYTVLFLSFIMGIASIINYFAGFKGVIIKNNSIKICWRYAKANQFFRIFRTIRFDEIVDCQIVSRNSLNINEKRYFWLGGIENEYIKIILDNGKYCFFALENQKDAYNEILKHINWKSIRKQFFMLRKIRGEYLSP